MSVDASLVSSAHDLTQNRIGHSATQSVDMHAQTDSNNIEYFQDEPARVNVRDSILFKHNPVEVNAGRSIINIKADNTRLSNRTSITAQTPFDNSNSIRDPESAVRLRAKFFGQGKDTKPTKKKSKGKPSPAMMPRNNMQTHSRDVMPVMPISHDGHNSGGSHTKVSYLIKQPSYTQVR